MFSHGVATNVRRLLVDRQRVARALHHARQREIVKLVLPVEQAREQKVGRNAERANGFPDAHVLDRERMGRCPARHSSELRVGCDAVVAAELDALGRIGTKLAVPVLVDGDGLADPIDVLLVQDSAGSQQAPE